MYVSKQSVQMYTVPGCSINDKSCQRRRSVAAEQIVRTRLNYQRIEEQVNL